MNLVSQAEYAELGNRIRHPIQSGHLWCLAPVMSDPLDLHNSAQISRQNYTYTSIDKISESSQH